MTSLTRIRNVSCYYIGGKDLVYFGEGNEETTIKIKPVCVYDPDLGEVTTLVNIDRTDETISPVGGKYPDVDIMNVKVGGVGLGQMHLYVQCNDGTLYIYNLNADGKSVGSFVKRFTAAQMKVLVGEPNLPRIRNFEITNDERYAFILNKPGSENGGDARTRLHVICAGSTWFSNPTLTVKEDVSVGEPRCMNKDEGDQFLFLPSGISSASTGYLYSIPSLTGASEANDVAPIMSGKPSDFLPGSIIYQQDFEGITAADTAAVTNALGWEICELFQKHTARYAVSNGTLYVDNLDLAGQVSTDSYVIVKSSDYMKPFCTNDYSYQYDVAYRAASGNTAADSGTRYVSLLCNYTGTNVYNTMDLRYGGNGYNQFRYKIPNEWNHYSTDIWPIEATGTNSMLYLLYGQPYSSSVTNGLKDRTCTVRVEMSMANGPSVYVNGLLVSKTDLLLPYWNQTKDFAYAICLKPSRDIKCEIDNIMIWQGGGVEPVWKGGAISDKSMRVLTASSGSANSSLPVNGAWTKDTTVFGITNDSTMVTATMDAMDFGHNFGASQYLYSYSDYFTRTNNITAQQGYQQKIYKWDVLNLVSNGMGFASNAVYTTQLKQLRSLDAYYIGGKDLIFYGEGQIGLAGATKVCVLDSSTGTETVLINATTNTMPSNVMNVKVSGVGLARMMHLFVQCEDGSLYVYELNADGLSVGDLVEAFTPAEIKALLGGVTFARTRSFEVTNDGKHAFFTYDGSDGLYVLGAVSEYEKWKTAQFGGDAGNEQVSGDNADPDNDGVVNALEYAMGLNPQIPETEGLPVGGVTDGGCLALSFRMNKEAFDAGVFYECEACTNLVTQDWTTLGVSELLPRGDSNQWWQAVFQHDVSVTNAPQRFMRLKVTLP